MCGRNGGFDRCFFPSNANRKPGAIKHVKNGLKTQEPSIKMMPN